MFMLPGIDLVEYPHFINICVPCRFTYYWVRMKCGDSFHFTCTVEPHYNGHHWEPKFPL